MTKDIIFTGGANNFLGRIFIKLVPAFYSSNVRPVDMAHYLVEKDEILPSLPPPIIPTEKPVRRAKEKSKPSLLSQPARLKSQRPSQLQTFQMIMESSSEDEDFERQMSQYSQKPKPVATSTQARIFDFWPLFPVLSNICKSLNLKKKPFQSQTERSFAGVTD